jgi:O-antigen/teichoic acid export membrane protein
LGGALALLAGLGVRWPLAALPAGSAVALVAAGTFARRAGVWTMRLKPDWQRSKMLLKESLPFAALGGMHVLILRFDVVVLSLVSTSKQTAVYDVASRAVDAISYVGAAVAAPSLFLFSRRLGRGDKDGAGRAFAEAVRITYLIGLPVSAGIVAVHSQAASVVFGGSYSGTSVPLAVLGAELWLFFLAGTQGSLILAAGLAVPALKVVAVNVATIVILDVVLIAAYGALGAAVAMALCQVVAVLLFARFIRRRLGMTTSWPSPRVVLAAVATGSAAWPTARVSLALGVATGLVVYPAVLFATRELGRGDLRRLLHTLR